MNKNVDSSKGMGLMFFGKISASVSHEIKNALAVINENAGLLQDFVLMSEKGMPLNPERVKAVAGKIRERVNQADGIVKNLNMFSHSVDASVSSVDIGENLELLAALARRPASIQRAVLEFTRPENPLVIKTSPFLLLHLCWRCLDAAMKSAGNDRTVAFSAEKSGKGARICFTKLENLSDLPDAFPGDAEKVLLNLLEAEFSIHNEEKAMILDFPSAVQQEIIII